MSLRGARRRDERISTEWSHALGFATGRFERFAPEVLASLERLDGPLRAYGEMVAVLWEAGQVTDAIELETHGNALASRCTFALLCGDPASALAAAPRLPKRSPASTTPCSARPNAPSSPATARAASFAPELTEVARARRFVATSLPGINDDAVADAALVVTELAANVVTHAGSPFTVRSGFAHCELRIRLEDGGRLSAPLDSIPGCGLGLVAALAERWGCEVLGVGKVVWASLPLMGQTHLRGVGHRLSEPRL